ncbi:MAG: AraC family transcriptional regulator of adaptative response [Halieaceae bacterium]|jgi:AraC family transcriptional regulator of adaptative response/methylated-DNA-[protein]-cysteine methyltransferase
MMAAAETTLLHNSSTQDLSRHYQLVARAIHYLRDHQRSQPTLQELSLALHISESQLQRVFSAWAGISPKRFLQVLTRERALAALKANASVLDASLEAGLSGPGRLHNLTVSCDAMTPGEIASGGGGLNLEHGWALTPFGAALIAWSERGICQLSFHDAEDDPATQAFRDEWPGAAHQRNDAGADALAEQIFAAPLERGRLHLLLRGTNFQIKVWEALLRVGPGTLSSYGQLARIAGVGQAHRAVGSAMAGNRIAYLIPCHRVIRESGDQGHYRWGTERKLALQAWESGDHAGAAAP